MRALNSSFTAVLLQICGHSTIKLFYFTFILVLLQLCGPLNGHKSAGHAATTFD